MRNILFFMIVVAVVGCSSRQESFERTDSTPVSSPAEQPTEPATSRYEVHEWGLIRAAPGDVLEVGAISPPGFVEPIAVDKPVLYFHAESPVQLEHVRVEAVGGTVREHWPLSTDEAFPSSIEWLNLALDPALAAGGDRCSGTFPPTSERPCSELPAGERCESPELGTVISQSATCLRSGSTNLPFLFYRSHTKTFTPPVTVRSLPSGELQLTNEGNVPIPGWVVRMRRGLGQVQTIAVPAPGAHEAVTIGTDFENAPAPPSNQHLSDEAPNPTDDMPMLPGSAAPGRLAVRTTLSDIGLDQGEIDAFLRAWDGVLFGERVVPLLDLPRPSASDRRGSTDGIPIDVLSDQTTRSDSILYFLPQQACDDVSRLVFTPAPTRVVRALAIWQPASG